MYRNERVRLLLLYHSNVHNRILILHEVSARTVHRPLDTESERVSVGHENLCVAENVPKRTENGENDVKRY